MERQSTPLHKAALKGLFEAVKILTERGAQLDCEDEAGYTALQISAFQGFDNIVALLLSKGANVNHQDESGDGYTALQLACQEGHVKVIATLLGNGGDVDLQNDTGDTALHLAVRNCHRGAVTLLLNAGANVAIEDDEGETPISSATNPEIQHMLTHPPSPLSTVPPSPEAVPRSPIAASGMSEVEVLKAQLQRAKQVGEIAQKEVLKLRKRAQVAETNLAKSQSLVDELRRQLNIAAKQPST